MDLNSSSPGRRRRGAELEAALLDAAMQELLDHGYAAFTVDGVARRAGTSRPVIYRRWATKTDLVRAAAEHALRRDPPAVPPDTGSLRGDLLALMTTTNETRVELSIRIQSILGSYFQETGTSPADFRTALTDGAPSPLDAVFDRAVERGEVDPSTLTPRRRALAFDLYRHEALMTLKPIAHEVLVEILDDIVLPLLSDQVATTGASRARR